LRPPKRFEVFIAVPDGGTDTHTRYAVIQNQDLREHKDVLVHVKSVRPVPSKWPSFLKFRSGRSVFTNDTGAGFRRRMTAVSNSWDSPPWRKVRG
jgi:cold shock CspA family protein